MSSVLGARPALGGWMVDRQISKASVLSCPCEETVTARGPVTQRRGRRRLWEDRWDMPTRQPR